MKEMWSIPKGLPKSRFRQKPILSVNGGPELIRGYSLTHLICFSGRNLDTHTCSLCRPFQSSCCPVVPAPQHWYPMGHIFISILKCYLNWYVIEDQFSSSTNGRITRNIWRLHTKKYLIFAATFEQGAKPSKVLPLAHITGITDLLVKSQSTTSLSCKMFVSFLHASYTYIL